MVHRDVEQHLRIAYAVRASFSRLSQSSFGFFCAVAQNQQEELGLLAVGESPKRILRHLVPALTVSFSLNSRATSKTLHSREATTMGLKHVDNEDDGPVLARL